MRSHRDLIREQFTLQADAFSSAPAILDEAALELLVEASGAGSSDQVLDSACGPGIVACAFGRVAGSVRGIDLTPAMIARGRERARAAGLSNVHFEVGEALRLPYRESSFSIVVTRFSFHHLLEPLAALLEMRRVCRPGGRVAVVDGLASPERSRAEALNRMEKLRDPSHVRLLDLEELEGLFPRAGLPPPARAFYRLETDLEGLLQRSFPVPGGAEEIRRMVLGSLEQDRLGLSPRRKGETVHLAYPVAVLVAERPSGTSPPSS